MFGLAHPREKKLGYVPVASTDPILEGSADIDTLCPVSKLTGHRTNPLTLLGMALGDKQSRLLDKLLQELPTVQSMDVSDADKIDMLASRLASGSLAEHDALVDSLSSVADTLFPADSKKAAEAKQVIDFAQEQARENASVAVEAE